MPYYILPQGIYIQDKECSEFESFQGRLCPSYRMQASPPTNQTILLIVEFREMGYRGQGNNLYTYRLQLLTLKHYS